MAANGVGPYAPTSCSSGGRGSRRAYDVGPSAYDHVLVGTLDRYVETGPQLVWRPMPTRRPGLAKGDALAAMRERFSGSWTEDAWRALTREPEGRTGE